MTETMARRRFLARAGLGVLGSALTGGLVSVPVARADAPKTLTVAWDTDIDSLDPAAYKSLGGFTTVANVYDSPLMWRVDPVPGQPGVFRSRPGEYAPSIAEAWSFEDNDATAVLKIRRGLTFPGGRPVTAHAVKYLFDRNLQSPGYMSNLYPSLIHVTKPDQFVVRDDYTFAIAMTAPSPMLMDVLCILNNAVADPDEVRPHATEADPWASAWMKRNAAGIGPYRLVKNEPGVEIVLEATPDYWGGAPAIGRIVLKFVPNESDRVLLLRRRAIDIVTGRPGLSPRNVKAFEGDPAFRIVSVPDTTCQFLAMNARRPPFDNVSVRQAVNYAIPIEAILPNVLYGYGSQMKSPLPNLMPGHDGSLSPYRYDIARARSLMAKAGLDKAPIPVDLAVRVGFQTHEQSAVWIQRELNKIGFQINIVKESDATFRQLAIKGDHVMSIESWQSWVNDPFYHLLFNFHSRSKQTNLVYYSNPEVDQLIDDNIHETNKDKRMAAALQAQKIIIDDAAWGFLWYDNWTRVMRADLMGVEKRWDTFERFRAMTFA